LHGLLFMSDPLLVFLALFAAESVWMDFIRVDVYSLYFTANGYGRGVGFSVGRNGHFRFLNELSVGGLAFRGRSRSCWPGWAATVESLGNGCFIDRYISCRG